MACIDCGGIKTHPKTLHDGRVVCTNCEDWRHECEARAIAALPSTGERRTWLESIERRRGLPERERLQRTIRSLWPVR